MSPLFVARLSTLWTLSSVFASVRMCAVFDEMVFAHGADILTEKGRGQSEELCKESDVSVTSIMSHTYG